MLPLLREILTEFKAASERAGPDDPVFVTSTGKPRSRHNTAKTSSAPRSRTRTSSSESAAYNPCRSGTSHELRHTFASVLVAIGKDPTHVMHQLGHTDPAFRLRVYAHVMRRSEDERERLRALVEAVGQ